VSLHLDVSFISIGTWVLFVNYVRKFVVPAAEAAGTHQYSTERCSCMCGNLT